MIEIQDFTILRSLQDRIDCVIKAYFEDKLKNPYEDYCGWDWDEDDGWIKIDYGYQTRSGDYDIGERYAKLDEIVEFSKHGSIQGKDRKG